MDETLYDRFKRLLARAHARGLELGDDPDSIETACIWLANLLDAPEPEMVTDLSFDLDAVLEGRASYGPPELPPRP